MCLLARNHTHGGLVPERFHCRSTASEHHGCPVSRGAQCHLEPARITDAVHGARNHDAKVRVRDRAGRPSRSVGAVTMETMHVCLYSKGRAFLFDVAVARTQTEWSSG